MMNDFGFTNSDSQFIEISKFRDAAAADEWSMEPLYPSHETAQEAARLTREGFVMQIITRRMTGKWKYQAQVSAWAPDGLCVQVSQVYDMNQIRANERKCNYCGAQDVATQRVGFAGRACDRCLPEKRKQIERPGWDS